MNRGFGSLTCADLRALAAAARGGRLPRPYSAIAVGRLLGAGAGSKTAEELEALALDPGPTAMILELLAAEREAAEVPGRRLELVWTGPETVGSRSRDTAVVMRELFSTAESSVLVSGFAVHQGRGVFEPLGLRMAERPLLQVRLFLNVARPQGTHLSESEAVRDFVAEFRKRQWPGPSLPDIYYDPRSLSDDPGGRAVLHAKCVIVDDRRALITSANLTQAAQERNIEAGVLIEDSLFARGVRSQFEALVETGTLRAAHLRHTDPQWAE